MSDDTVDRVRAWLARNTASVDDNSVTVARVAGQLRRDPEAVAAAFEQLRGAGRPDLRVVSIGHDDSLRCPVCVVEHDDLPAPLGSPASVAIGVDEIEHDLSSAVPGDELRAAGWECDEHDVRILLAHRVADRLEWDLAGWIMAPVTTVRGRDVQALVPAREVRSGDGPVRERGVADGGDGQ